jgi:hypothetical protein
VGAERPAAVISAVVSTLPMGFNKTDHSSGDVVDVRGHVGLWTEGDVSGTKTEVIALHAGALTEYLWVEDAAIERRRLQRIGNGERQMIQAGILQGQEPLLSRAACDEQGTDGEVGSAGEPLASINRAIAASFAEWVRHWTG